MFESLLNKMQGIEDRIERMDKKIEEQKADIRQDQERLKEEIRKDIQHDMVVLLDTEFKRNFDLLGERLDELMVKMPSEDDMDIIDGRLKEHDSELKVLRQDVNELKKAL